ncbi:MAG: aminotransferase class III-fold pyridoxal phosphate-dependent enzyme [Dehalococcoidales bacterium]|nr:aminotransferase class III-fold pyridoxal phosphate-dependent enzyme [Dehalococcoidales bacterium]
MAALPDSGTVRSRTVQRDWNRRYPVAERGEGVYIWDKAGKRYIDGSGGSSVVTSIGHGVKEIPEAMYQQAQKISFVPAHAFANEWALKLGDLVAEWAPGEMRNACKTWFGCTGTDAVESALRLARSHFVEKGRPSKHLIISRWQSFHGNSIGTAGAHGFTFRRRYFTPMYVGNPHIPPAYCFRCYFEKTYPDCNLLCARSLEKEIRQHGPENVAAFIAEPVVGAALVCTPAPAGYFEIIRHICSEYDVLFIADEVMTGWGRTGKFWGVDHWNVTPDIITTAKGMSSGYTPISATIARDSVWEPLESKGAAFRAGHTLNYNPVSCAGACANIQYLVERRLWENAAEVGDYMLARMATLVSHRIVGDVRGRGLMLGVEFVADKRTKAYFPAEQRIARRLEDAALQRGLIVYSSTGCVDGIAGDMILLAPPLIITRGQVDELVAILDEAIGAVEDELAI